jgi:hypothetical protein
MSLSPSIKKKNSRSNDTLSRVNTEKRSSTKGFSSPERGSVNDLIDEFCSRDLDTLDLTGYALSDLEIY